MWRMARETVWRSELADLAGVNVETLRYYERCGLLSEPARNPSSGGKRFPTPFPFSGAWGRRG